MGFRFWKKRIHDELKTISTFIDPENIILRFFLCKNELLENLKKINKNKIRKVRL